MKKQIKLQSGNMRAMTFEEVLVAYKPLVIKIAKHYNKQGLNEDILQDGYLALWKAYSTYNGETRFSTHAYWLVRQEYKRIQNKNLAVKRDKREKEILNMEYDLGDGNMLGDLIADETSNFEQAVLDKDFIEYIKVSLNNFEMDLLAFNLGYVQAKDLVEKYSTTKQNISNKNSRFKKKLEEIIKKYNN